MALSQPSYRVPCEDRRVFYSVNSGFFIAREYIHPFFAATSTVSERKRSGHEATACGFALLSQKLFIYRIKRRQCVWILWDQRCRGGRGCLRDQLLASDLQAKYKENGPERESSGRNRVAAAVTFPRYSFLPFCKRLDSSVVDGTKASVLP